MSDPRGLQPERTELAWRRSHLALVVAALAVVRHAVAGGPLPTAVAAACVAALAVCLLLGRPRVAGTAAAMLAIGCVELVALLAAR